MEKKIRVIQVGAGATGRSVARLLIERGCELVACVDPFCPEGKDIGEMAGIGPIGVPVEKDLDAALERTHPDIATVCTVTELARIAPTVRSLVTHGCNVLTLAEEAFYPWPCNEPIARELDALAKEHGVSIVGSGMQDLFWQSICSVLAGGVHNIRSIKGINRAVGDGAWGKTNADAVYAGWTVEEYERDQAKRESDSNVDERSIFGVALCSMVAEMGLEVKGMRAWHKPILSTYDHYIPEIDRMIPKGNICGLEEGCEVETTSGMLLSGILYDQYTNPGDTALQSWEIEGDPSMKLVIEDVRGDMTPFTILTNRIPDVINAEPGFRTCMELPKFTAHPLPLPSYLK